MRVKKLFLVALLFFFSMNLYADGHKLKLSFDDKPKPIFGLLQFTSCLLMTVDTVCTYNSYWNYGRRELNPVLRKLLPHPDLVFVYRIVVNIGIVLITNTLYKRNKVLAYSFLIALNVIATYFILDHMRMWRSLSR